MWIFLNDAFLSIVAPTPDSDAEKDDMLVVRARLTGDIQRVFPKVRVMEDKELKRDYRYRALVPRAQVIDALTRRVQDIKYTNFKDSTGPHNDPRHMVYMGVWRVMWNEQEYTRPKPKVKAKGKKSVAPRDVGAAYGDWDDDIFWDVNAKVWRRPLP